MAKHAAIQAFKGLAGAVSVAGMGLLLEQLRANFYFSRVSSGDRLPPVRKLAEQLSISPTTALELYRKLEEAGFVESRERSGTFLRRVGGESQRDPHRAGVFSLVERTAARLALLGVSSTDFARLLLRHSGSAPAGDFRFGLLTSQEVFELMSADLRRRTGCPLALVRLSPHASADEEVRAGLASDPSLRCLIASYLYAERAARLAMDYGRDLIMLRLDGELARMFDLPSKGQRYIVTRDQDYAAAIRRLMFLLHGAHAATQVVAASIDELDLMAQIDRDATRVYVSPLCWDRALARFGGTKECLPLASRVSQQTLDDMLFHLVFADQKPGT